MTISWPQKPKSDPEPEPLPVTVTSPGGVVFEGCDTVAGVDGHIEELRAELVKHKGFPKRLDADWESIDALLARRQLLTLEAWLSPSDLPL